METTIIREPVPRIPRRAPQFDSLLRQLQTAVSQPTPDLHHIHQLQQQLAAEHEQVLAHLQAQNAELVSLDVPAETVKRANSALATYQTRYTTLSHFLETDDLEGLAAFLGETLPLPAVSLQLPHQALPPVMLFVG